MAARERLFVAYVLRDADADEVNGLRRALGSSELARIAPHLTLVPPLNVATDAIPDARRVLAEVARQTTPIGISLGGPSTFPPAHHVIYLQVNGELGRLANLREHCYQPPLVPAAGRESRSFVPHVSLRSHADADLVTASKRALAEFVLPVSIDRVALLRRDEQTSERRWEICDEVVLGGSATFGRGGRELHVTQASLFADEDLRLFADNGRSPDGIEPAASALVLRVHVAGELVGLCGLIWMARCVFIESFLVGHHHRRTGIGRQLAAYVDRFAMDRGATEVHASVPDDGLDFARACGYREIGPSGDPRCTRVVRMLGSS